MSHSAPSITHVSLPFCVVSTFSLGESYVGAHLQVEHPGVDVKGQGDIDSACGFVMNPY